MSAELFRIEETPAGPDSIGQVHLKRNKYTAICGAVLTGDIVPDDIPLDCLICHEEHPHDS